MSAIKQKPRHGLRILALALLCCTVIISGFVISPPRVGKADTNTAVSIAAANTAVTQNFDTLVNTGTGTLAANTPAGWGFLETGTSANTSYTAGTGSGNAGDTYSFGAAASTERAFGSLQSGSNTPTIGARFVNNTGATITSLAVAYTGEQWRLGTSGRAVPDRLDFQFGATATSLSSTGYVDVDALDFVQPLITGTVGALDGNAAANRTAISATISSLSIAPGAEFWIRWNSFDATGADDGLGIDDFSITANPSGGGGNQAIATTCAGPLGTQFGTATSGPVSATDPDGTVVSASITSTPVTGISLTGFTAAGAVGGTASATLSVANTTAVGSYPVDITWTNNDSPTPQTAVCTVTVNVIAPVTLTAINQIQGSGATSPLTNGTSLSVRGIVTARTSTGFYIQSRPADVDSDPNTSEGLFVFTSTAPPAAAAVGNDITFTGTLSEFLGTGTPAGLSLTELTTPTNLIINSSGNALPSPVVIDSTIATTPSSLEPALPLRYERFEFMRVTTSLVVGAPNDGNLTETSATAVPFDDFYGVPVGVQRAFREPGIQSPNAPPSGTIPPIPQFDANPERLRVRTSIRTDGSTGLTPTVVTAGTTVGVTGVLDYFGSTRQVFTIIPDATPSVSGGLTAAVPVPVPNSGDLTIGSANLERFYDTVDDAGTSDVVLTVTAFNNRLNKASLMVRNVMRNPDVIGVQEMENLTTLQALATKINTDAGSPSTVNYQAFLFEGVDVGGIDVGFLVNTARINVVDVTQLAVSTFTNPDTSTSILNDRPSLVLRGTVISSGYAFTVVNNHLRSLSGVDDETAGSGSNGWPTGGARVRAKRRAQAEFLANFLQGRQTANPSERLIVIGDFNAFQFNDGLVDSMGTIKGTPAAAGAAVLTSADLVNPDLINLVETQEAATERYSFIFDGNAQTLDHVLISQNLNGNFVRINHGRNNADFPENATFRNDPNRSERVSDHDPVVVAFNAAPATPVNINGNVSLSFSPASVQAPTCGAQGYSNDIVLSGTLTNAGSTPITTPAYFEVTELREANGVPPAVPFRLISANGATCTSGGVVGAQQTIDLSTQPVPGTLAPGASVPVTFRIAAPSIRRLRFLINVFGVLSSSSSNRAKGLDLATMKPLTFEFEPFASPVSAPGTGRIIATRARR